MASSSVSNLSGPHVQLAFAGALENTPAAAKTTTAIGVDYSFSPDRSQISPFAQLVSTLQGLQQSDPAKYADVTKQIATSLNSAAQAVQSQGNSTSANELTQLAAHFTKSSQTGQFPDLTNLPQSIGEGGHHYHHQVSVEGQNATANSSGSFDSVLRSSAGSAGNAAGQSLGQVPSLFQSGGNQAENSAPSAPPEPLAIILQTLVDASLNDSDN